MDRGGRPQPNIDGRVGLAFLGAPSVREMAAVARRAEARGFDSVWVAETRMTRDAVTAVAAIARETESIRVGTGIVNVYTRGPVLLAVTFATLAEFAPGRIVMGLGTGSPLVLAAQGVPFDRPLTRLREHVDVILQLLRGAEVTYEGEVVRVEQARIEDVLAGDGSTGAGARIPLYLGVTGMRGLELAGEVADGVLLNVGLPPQYLDRALERLAAGAARRGRSPSEIEVAMLVYVSPDDDGRAAVERARRFVALYLSLFPNLARETGLDPELLDTLPRVVAAGGIEAGAALVADDVVRTVTAAGTPEECRARLHDYRRAGVHVPVLVPADGALELAVEALGPEAAP